MGELKICWLYFILFLLEFFKKEKIENVSQSVVVRIFAFGASDVSRITLVLLCVLVAVGHNINLAGVSQPQFTSSLLHH